MTATRTPSAWRFRAAWGLLLAASYLVVSLAAGLHALSHRQAAGAPSNVVSAQGLGAGHETDACLTCTRAGSPPLLAMPAAPRFAAGADSLQVAHALEAPRLPAVRAVTARGPPAPALPS